MLPGCVTSSSLDKAPWDPGTGGPRRLLATGQVSREEGQLFLCQQLLDKWSRPEALLEQSVEEQAPNPLQTCGHLAVTLQTPVVMESCQRSGQWGRRVVSELSCSRWSVPVTGYLLPCLSQRVLRRQGQEG